MNFHTKKTLGQHLLNSKSALNKIISTANIKKGDVILEIGPGTGILTEELLKSGAKVFAIEKDPEAIIFLKNRFAKEINNNLYIVEGDILEQKIENIMETPYSVVSNIPYYITGAILEKFLENNKKPEKMVLLVQKEVADRITAKNGKESILSISVKAFGQPKIIAKVPKGAFIPPPKVDSAILLIEKISNRNFTENNIQKDIFFTILKNGFAHKRKILKRNLETVIEKETIKDIWQILKLENNTRAEEISLDNWLLITKTYKDK